MGSTQKYYKNTFVILCVCLYVERNWYQKVGCCCKTLTMLFVGGMWNTLEFRTRKAVEG